MALYDSIGRTYATTRQPDPRIAAALEAALGDVATVLNVGAGAGSYEPPGKTVLAVEPSAEMIRQRPANSAPCLQGVAEKLPVETASVDAAMAVLSIHHWADQKKGLAEMRRVARKRVVLLTWMPEGEPFWLTEDYFPEIIAHDRTIFPDSSTLRRRMERIIGPTRIMPIQIPHDCIDGFLCAWWRRPEAYLDAQVRAGISSFARFDPAEGLNRLRDDLATGAWAARNRALMKRDTMDLGYRIVASEVAD